MTMADMADSALAEAATAAEPATIPKAREDVGEDGDNRFQKAISAWRSMWL